MMHALLESGETLEAYLARQVHQWAVKAREYLNQGLRERRKVMECKSDIEIYLGIYLITAWFFKKSHLFGIVVYWQLLRVRYMIGGLMREAFYRLDRKLVQQLQHNRACPGPVKILHKKLRDSLIYLGDLNNQPI